MRFPNAFTPSPDGPTGGAYDPEAIEVDNNIFHPKYLNLEEYKLEIFNRWGELIFESNNPAIGWDGYYMGKLAKEDVYVWKVAAKCTNGNYLNNLGTVTLIR